MEEQSFYNKYRESIINSRKRWMAKDENREKFKDSNRYRLQLYKNSYKKLQELIKENRFTEVEMNDLKQFTKNRCIELKEMNNAN
jgi:uncharacterized protein YqfB (UPF0267 family)